MHRGVTGAAGTLLVAGTLAWMFPREATAVVGVWCLPALALSCLILAVLIVIDWPVLRVLVAALAVVLVLGWNQDSPTSTAHFIGISLGLLAMGTIARVADTADRLRAVVFAFLVAGITALLVGLVGTGTRPNAFVNSLLPGALAHAQLGLAGLQGGIVNPNALAAAALLVTPLGLAVLMFGLSRRTDWFWLGPASLVLVLTGGLALVICDSLTAWVAVWLMALGLLVRGPRRMRARVVLGVLVIAPLVAAGAGAVWLSRDAFLSAIGGVWQSADDRAYIVSQGAQTLRDAPWFGIGLNEYRTVHVPRPSAVAHAHNMFIQTALDVGLVGSVAYWGLVLFLLARANEAARVAGRFGRSAAIGSALSLIAVTLFGLTDAVALGARVGLFQWLASGVILAAWRTRSIESV
jgi:O-antigen ligase